MKLLFITIMSMLLVACIPNNCNPGKDIKQTTKTEVKEVTVLFTKTTPSRMTNTTYHYVITGYAGTYTAFGNNDCVKLFKMEMGKSYKVDFNFNKNGPIMVDDLCELAARIKQKNPNM